jgi:hypothetical protein
MARFVIFVLSILTTVACQPTLENTSFLVSLVADGRERTYSLDESLTVEEFLAKTDINIQVGENDRLTPPRFTQLSDGMKITIVRVIQETECEQEVIPFTREVIQNEGLAPNEERIVQVGQNGTQETCYRLTIEDGVRRNRVISGQPTVLTAPINEVVIVGVSNQSEPISVVGTLAYINNKNAWVMSGNSTTKRPLTTTSDLDSLVFSLSADGRYLLYSAKPASDDSFVNQLWLIETTANAQPIQLSPTNVLYAEWIPNQDDTISYSTSEPQALFPYWRALNNVLTMQLDPISGKALNNNILVPESGGGLLGWWGTVFRWSPDGEKLAWVRADSMGIVDNEGNLQPLIEYPLFRTTQNWSWRADISWSNDGQLIATTSHGAPIGGEPAEASPVFNTVIVDINNQYESTLVEGAGIWASPKFSNSLNLPESKYTSGYIAYWQAREPYNSINGEYNLIVADRDGSNAQIIFPKKDQVGMTTKDFGLTPQDFVWSPDGAQIALIYQGNLWVIDVVSAVSHQLTFDGQSEHPVWTN